MVLMRIQNFWDLMPCCWKDEWFPAFQRTILSLSSGIMHKEEIFFDGLILEDDGATFETLGTTQPLTQHYLAET